MQAFVFKLLIFACKDFGVEWFVKVFILLSNTVYFLGQNLIIVFKLTFTKHLDYYAQQFFDFCLNILPLILRKSPIYLCKLSWQVINLEKPIFVLW